MIKKLSLFILVLLLVGCAAAKSETTETIYLLENETSYAVDVLKGESEPIVFGKVDYVYGEDHALIASYSTQNIIILGDLNGEQVVVESKFNDMELESDIHIMFMNGDTCFSEQVLMNEYDEEGILTKRTSSIDDEETVYEWKRGTNGVDTYINGELAEPVEATESNDLYEYDENHNLIHYQINSEYGCHDITYVYENGKLISENHQFSDQSEHTITYEYDGNGCLAKITDTDANGAVWGWVELAYKQVEHSGRTLREHRPSLIPYGANYFH